MRKVVVLGMCLFGPLTILGGIAESSPRHAGPPVFHIITAVILIVLALIHTILNRRAIFNYFKGTKDLRQTRHHQ